MKPDDNDSPPSSQSLAQEDPDLEKGQQSEQTPTPNENKKDDLFLVKFEDDDRENPRNWRPYYKAWLTFLLGMLAFAGSLGSSIIAPAEPTIAKEFNVSVEATVLCVALVRKVTSITLINV